MKLLIVGAGGHGKCCFEIAKDMSIFETISFLNDDLVGKTVNNCAVIDTVDKMSAFYSKYTSFHIAVGNKKIRNKLHLLAKKWIYIPYFIPFFKRHI